MEKLFDRGYQMARAGYQWQKCPTELHIPFLSMIPYEDLGQEDIALGECSEEGKYDDELDLKARHMVPQKY